MNNKRAVIIDNDNKSLRVLEHILAVTGYDWIVIKDALSAVDAVVQRQPDVILLELKMPHKTGFELADEINRVFLAERVPMIGLSAKFKDEFGFLLSFCGIKGFIQKPFKPLEAIWELENIHAEISPVAEGSRLDQVESEILGVI